MSEQEIAIAQAWDMSESEGFFEDAGVDVANISDDPFNFGNQHWPVMVKKVAQPKVTAKGDKLGIMVYLEVVHDKFKGVRETEEFGKWTQVPTPKKLQIASGVKFDPDNNVSDGKVVSSFKAFLWALGYNADEMNKANPGNMTGRVFISKLRAREEDGFWRIGLSDPKRLPEVGTEEHDAVFGESSGITVSANGSSGGGMDAIAAAMAADVS